MVPSDPENGAHIGAERLASEAYQSASLCTEAVGERNKNGDPKIAASSNNVERCCPEAARPTALTIDREVDPLKVSPTDAQRNFFDDAQLRVKSFVPWALQDFRARHVQSESRLLRPSSWLNCHGPRSHP